MRAGEQIAGMVTAVDDSLGRMIHKLQAAGLYERSVILLTTGEQCPWPTPAAWLPDTLERLQTTGRRFVLDTSARARARMGKAAAVGTGSSAARR